MKLRLLTLLAAAALAAAPAAAQTIKSLGYTTNGEVVYSGTNALTFTNALSFGTNAAAATRTGLGLGATNNVTFKSLVVGGPTTNLGLYDFYALTAKFDEIEVGGHGLAPDAFGNLTLYTALYFDNTTDAAATRTNLGATAVGDAVFTATNAAAGATALGLGLAALTNTSNVTMMRALAGSTNTNQPFSGSISVVGTNNTNTLVFSNGILLEAP